MVIPALARAAAQIAAKQLAKKGAKKVVKKKASPQQRLERMLRSENKGDARTSGRIKRLREQEEAGLISPGERQRALNRLTKSQKALPKRRRK